MFWKFSWICLLTVNERLSLKKLWCLCQAWLFYIDHFFDWQKTPFAGADPNQDLGKFYRECQGAPQLAMCTAETNITEALADISSQIQMFESNIEGFDDFVTSITESVTVE